MACTYTVRSLDGRNAHLIHILNIFPNKAVLPDHMFKLLEESLHILMIEACGSRQTSWFCTSDGQIWMVFHKGWKLVRFSHGYLNKRHHHSSFLISQTDSVTTNPVLRHSSVSPRTNILTYFYCKSTSFLKLKLFYCHILPQSFFFKYTDTNL